MKALVTGATSGIGRALATELARAGHSLVLVARDRERLDSTAVEIRRAHGVSVELLPADLSDAAGLGRVEQRLRDEADPVDVLVNNAGIGLPPGGYLGNPVAASASLNALNIDAVMRLSHAALPGMVERGRGGLITVSSIAGFVPGTAATTYSASKAWATAFGEGLHTLLRGTGVTSTVVAPGFVRSEFHQRSGVSTSQLPDRLWLQAEDVARATVRGFERGHALVVPGAFWRISRALFAPLPRAWRRRAFARLMGAKPLARTTAPTAASTAEPRTDTPKDAS